MLSYRHAFHAGNHADVLKHLVLIELLDYYGRKDKPWYYIDTHAGGGCYALDSEQAGKTAEAADGIGRLWGHEDLPPAVAAYVAAVGQFNPQGRLLFYPGSPALAMTRARAQDRLRLFELHPTDARALDGNVAQLEAGRQIAVFREDGFEGLKKFIPPPSRRALVLCDPSYEIKSDYARVLAAMTGAITKGSRDMLIAAPSPFYVFVMLDAIEHARGDGLLLAGVGQIEIGGAGVLPGPRPFGLAVAKQHQPMLTDTHAAQFCRTRRGPSRAVPAVSGW